MNGAKAETGEAAGKNGLFSGKPGKGNSAIGFGNADSRHPQDGFGNANS